jgi:hypothetical protein
MRNNGVSRIMIIQINGKSNCHVLSRTYDVGELSLIEETGKTIECLRSYLTELSTKSGSSRCDNIEISYSRNGNGHPKFSDI